MLNPAKRVLPLLLPIPVAASELSLPISRVYKLINDKKLDLVKLGPKTSRVTGASIERLLAQRDEPSEHIANLKQFKKLPA